MTAKSASQLATEIQANVPSNNPPTLTAASLRQLLQDLVDSLNLGGTPFVISALSINIGSGNASIAASGNTLQLNGVTIDSLGDINANGTFTASTLRLGVLGVASGSITLTGSASGTVSIAVAPSGAVCIISGHISTPPPVTLGGTSGTLSPGTPSGIIAASGTFTLSLPNPASLPGVWISLKSTTTFPVNSLSSNIVPLGSSLPGSSIFTSSAVGKWVELQSDGTNWITMMGSAGQ